MTAAARFLDYKTHFKSLTNKTKIVTNGEIISIVLTNNE